MHPKQKLPAGLVDAVPTFLGCPGRMRTGSDNGSKASVSNSLVIFRTKRIDFILRCALSAHYSRCML